MLTPRRSSVFVGADVCVDDVELNVEVAFAVDPTTVADLVVFGRLKVDEADASAKVLETDTPVPELTAVPLPVPVGAGGSAVVGVNVGKTFVELNGGKIVVGRGTIGDKIEGKNGGIPMCTWFSSTSWRCWKNGLPLMAYRSTNLSKFKGSGMAKAGFKAARVQDSSTKFFMLHPISLEFWLCCFSYR